MITLETAKKLWEAGVRIETEKWWCITKKGSEILLKSASYPKILTNSVFKNGLVTDDFQGGYEWENDTEKVLEAYPAPSTDELLGVLPEFIDEDEEYNLHIEKVVNKDYIVRYENGNAETYSGIEGESDYYQCNRNLSEAIASMVLYLISQGYHYEEEEKCLRR